MIHKISSGIELVKWIYVQRIKGYSPPGDPHFDAQSAEKHRELLGRAKLYVEYGSGGSTRLADTMGVETVCVESDPYYAAAVRKTLDSNSSVRIIDIHLGLTGPWGIPIFSTPNPKRIRRWNMYPLAPYTVLENGRVPEFVLVDGRFRRACALESARRAGLAGVPLTIMFDDYYKEARDHYHAVEEFLGKPRRIGRAAFFEDVPPQKTALITPQTVTAASGDYR